MLVDVFESSEEAGEREKEGQSEGNEEELSEDPGLWPEKLTAQQRDTLVCRLASQSGDLTKVAPKDKDGKAFPSYLQYVKSANGREKIRRDWLIHSDSANALFCIPCLLFSHEQTRPSKSATMGQDRLNSLAILSIESQLAKQLDFTDLITDFANKKTRQWGFTGM